MSEDVVAKARAALEGVTEGPWEQNGINGVHTVSGSCIATTHQVAARACKVDAEFIAASRTLVPELADKVDWLTEQLIDARLEIIVADVEWWPGQETASNMAKHLNMTRSEYDHYMADPRGWMRQKITEGK